MKGLGLIGYGAFGSFIAKHLNSYFKIHAYDPKGVEDSYVLEGTLEEVASQPLVILAVPVQSLESLLLEIRNYVQPSSLVMDVSSVKMKPVALMQTYLPLDVDILATHPLFGPESGKNGIAGLPIVISPVRMQDFKPVESFLEKTLGLEILIKTPEEHDREMAYVQGLTHFIGKGLERLGIKDLSQKTVAYTHLLAMHTLLQYGSDALFKTIQLENPYAREVREKFLYLLEDINLELEN